MKPAMKSIMIFQEANLRPINQIENKMKSPYRIFSGTAPEIEKRLNNMHDSGIDFAIHHAMATDNTTTVILQLFDQ